MSSANAFIAVARGGPPTPFPVTALVLRLGPWFLPRYMNPLAGMIVASSLDTSGALFGDAPVSGGDCAAGELRAHRESREPGRR